MKKFMFLLMCVLTMQVAMADNDKPITFEQLPQTAQQFVKQNFPDLKIAFVKMEKDWFDTEYSVMFLNGDKIDFQKDGQWKEIKCRRSTVPMQVVPAQIRNHVKTNYPDADVLSIEKDRYEYEVRLSNFWELKFDLKYNLIDMDHEND